MRAAPLLAGLVMLAASCTSGPAPTEGGRPTPGVSGKESQEPIVIGIAEDISSLDPGANPNDNDYSVLGTTYAGLLRYKVEQTPDGAFRYDRTQVEPLLADSYEVSKDELTYTFKLKEGQRFPLTGNSLTANDVKYSIARALGIGQLSAFLVETLGVTEPSQVQAIDDSTVRIELEEPNPRTLLALASIALSIVDSAEVEQHATSEDAWATQWMTTHYAGIGSYVIDSRIPGQQIVLTRNEDFLEPGQHHTVILRVITSPQAREQQLLAGTLDAAEGIPPKDLGFLGQQPGIRLLSFDSNIQVLLSMVEDPGLPFSDVRVRQAIAMVLPYDRVIAEALFGFGTRMKGPFPPQSPGYDDSAWNYATDPASAKELLAEAGYPDGFRTELYYQVGGFHPGQETAAILIRSALADIGINAELRGVTVAVWDDLTYSKKTPMNFIFASAWIQDPWYLSLLFYAQDSILPTGYESDAVNTLLDEIRTDPAPWEAPQARELQEVLIQDLPMIPIAALRWTYVTRDSVAGYLFTDDSGNGGYQLMTKAA